jgi:hypothetical protein
VAAGIGAVAVSADLRSQKFGWRQGISILATALFTLTAIPILAAAGNGRWMLPQRSTRSAVSWMANAKSTDPSGRPATKGPAVWIGNVALLPTPGWMLPSSVGGVGTAYALASDGLPAIGDQWLPPRTQEDKTLESALREVADGGTSRVGALVPGVRYFVLAERAALDARRSTSLAGLRAALRRQFDLREVESPRGLTVFENVAWVEPIPAQNQSRAIIIGVLRAVQVLAWIVAIGVMAGSRRRRRSRELVLLDQERSFDQEGGPDGSELSHPRVGDFLSTTFADYDNEFDPIAGFDEPVTTRTNRTNPRLAVRARRATETASEASDNEPPNQDAGLADELWDKWSERQDRRRQGDVAAPKDERRKRADADNAERRKR